MQESAAEQIVDGGLVWVLRKNCNLKPMQLLMFFGLALLLSFSVAGFFATQGIWWVLPFASVEVLLLAVAFVFYARHATDRDVVVIHPERGLFELSIFRGGRCEEQAWQSGRVVLRLGAGHSSGSLVHPKPKRDDLIHVYVDRVYRASFGEFVTLHQRVTQVKEIQSALSSVLKS